MSRPRESPQQAAERQTCNCKSAPECVKCPTSKASSNTAQPDDYEQLQGYFPSMRLQLRPLAPALTPRMPPALAQSYSPRADPAAMASSTKTFLSLICPVQAPSTSAAPPATQPSYEDMITELDSKTVRRLLVKLCKVSPTAQSYVRTSYVGLAQQMQLQARPQPQFPQLNRPQTQSGQAHWVQTRPPYPAPPPTVNIDFKPYGAVVWQMLRGKYSNPRPHHQYEIFYTIFDEVNVYIEDIGAKTSKMASFGTKLSAIETLQKIGESIIIVGRTAPGDVRRQYKHAGILGTVMLRITESMTPEERRRVAAHKADEKGGSLLAKMRWLNDEVDRYDGLEGLDVSKTLGLFVDSYGEF